MPHLTPTKRWWVLAVFALSVLLVGAPVGGQFNERERGWIDGMRDTRDCDITANAQYVGKSCLPRGLFLPIIAGAVMHASYNNQRHRFIRNVFLGNADSMSSRFRRFWEQDAASDKTCLRMPIGIAPLPLSGNRWTEIVIYDGKHVHPTSNIQRNRFAMISEDALNLPLPLAISQTQADHSVRHMFYPWPLRQVELLTHDVSLPEGYQSENDGRAGKHSIDYNVPSARPFPARTLGWLFISFTYICTIGASFLMYHGRPWFAIVIFVIAGILAHVAVSLLVFDSWWPLVSMLRLFRT